MNGELSRVLLSHSLMNGEHARTLLVILIDERESKPRSPAIELESNPPASPLRFVSHQKVSPPVSPLRFVFHQEIDPPALPLRFVSHQEISPPASPLRFVSPQDIDPPALPLGFVWSEHSSRRERAFRLR